MKKLKLLNLTLETFEKSKEKLITLIGMCKHFHQNKSCQDEIQTENHWHSRHKHHHNGAALTNPAFYSNRVIQGSSIATSY